MNGFIKVWRCVRGKDFYQEKPFDNFRAWIDLLMEANFTDKPDRFGEMVLRGELHTSEPFLANRWGWHRSKVHRFLECLKREQQIELQTNKKRTKIRIVNYDKYQSVNLTGEQLANKKPNKKPNKRSNTTEEGSKKEEGSTPSDNLVILSRSAIALIDPDTNEHRETELLKLTVAERDSLLKTFGAEMFNREVAKAEDWCRNRVKRFRELKDHAAFLRTWMRKTAETPRQSSFATQPASKAQAKREREGAAMRRVADAFDNAIDTREQDAALLRLLGGGS